VQNLIGIDPEFNLVRSEILNELTLVPGQKIGIDSNLNAVDATIKNALLIKEGQSIGIDPTKNQVKVKRQEKQVSNLPTLIFQLEENADPETPIELFIFENAKRDHLILTADINNSGPVWIGVIESEGTPIFPGDRVFIEGANKLFFTAPIDHMLYASEVTIKDEP